MGVDSPRNVLWTRWLLPATLFLLFLHSVVVSSNAFGQSGPPLQVTSLQPSRSGFQIQFNRRIDPSSLNLYSTQAGDQGPADVSVIGTATGPVAGSLIVGAAGDSLFF